MNQLVVVYIPPMLVIGEADEGFDTRHDGAIGGRCAAVLRFPAVMLPAGPTQVAYSGLGPALNFPPSAPWPWRPATAQEQEGYKRFRAMVGSGIVVPAFPGVPSGKS